LKINQINATKILCKLEIFQNKVYNTFNQIKLPIFDQYFILNDDPSIKLETIGRDGRDGINKNYKKYIPSETALTDLSKVGIDNTATSITTVSNVSGINTSSANSIGNTSIRQKALQQAIRDGKTKNRS